jgi:hypothetical protein
VGAAGDRPQRAESFEADDSARQQETFFGMRDPLQDTPALSSMEATLASIRQKKQQQQQFTQHLLPKAKFKAHHQDSTEAPPQQANVSPAYTDPLQSADTAKVRLLAVELLLICC